MDTEKLINEYRATIPTDVLHLWATDAIIYLRLLTEEVEKLKGEAIVAPAECSENCDDPHCPYSHKPLTLLEAYENAVSRLRTAESEIASLRQKLGVAREALGAIRLYANDTLSGRIDGPDDRDWQRSAVVELRDRARAALTTLEAPDA